MPGSAAKYSFLFLSRVLKLVSSNPWIPGVMAKDKINKQITTIQKIASTTALLSASDVASFCDVLRQRGVADSLP